MIEPLTLDDANRLYDSYMAWRAQALAWLRQAQQRRWPGW